MSSFEDLTTSIAGSAVVRPPPGVCGANDETRLSALSGSFGVTRKVSGSGLEPSSS